MSSSRENAGSPDVETRMVGSELTIFSNINWRIYQYHIGGLLYTYRDLLESPHYALFCKKKTSNSHTKNQRANYQPGGLYNLEVAQLKRLYADTHCHVFQNDMHIAQYVVR